MPPHEPTGPVDGPAPSRPLPVLRALIDAVDHDVLQLLARRNGLVGEIAAFKRANGVAIRDPQREQEIIADRRARAATLGLRPEVVESLYRLTLWASRDRQAALRAEVPPDVEERTVAIIGGAGQMGRLLERLFADLGHGVMIADLDTTLRPEEAAAVADVVVVSVPIDVTVDVIRRVGPLVREDALLVDVTSIKTAPMEAMLETCCGSVAGTHPLFGPSVHSLQGQRIVVTPGRGETWHRWLCDMLAARGLVIKEATPETHDRAMAIVQVLVHFATEVMGRTLSDLDVPIDETLEFTSPVYLMELLMAARHFAQSPDLYASIQMSNPALGEVTEAFVRAAQGHRDTVTGGDREAMRVLFETVRTRFGVFGDEALEQSSYLIDRLVERA